MADTESLIEGTGTVKKNIHWFIIGLVSLVIVIAIFAQDANTKKRKADKAKEPEKVVQTDGNSENIKGALDKQKYAEIQNPAALAGDKLSVPAMATVGVGKDAKEADVLSAQEAQAVEDSRRDAQMTGSAILAISPDSSEFERLAAYNPAQPNQQQSNLDIDEDELRRALAGPILPANAPATQRAPTKEEQDEAWLQNQSNRKKTTAIVEDIANSPYTIFEGAVIPAILMTKVSSQLPGQVTAVVSEDVYDGVTGSHLIIPKGSSLYGSYNNSIIQGQSRLMVAFTRLKLPGGRTVSLPAMPAADKVGQHGIDGDVNNRYFQRFGFSFFTAVLGAFADKNNNGNTTVINTDSASNGVATAAGTILTDISRSEQQRASQIQPIIVLKQGEKFNINVNRDISIAPYM